MFDQSTLEGRLRAPVNIPEGAVARRSGCILAAKALRDQKGGAGNIYYVFHIDVFPWRYGVNQTYYIPDPTDLGALALNGRENGFYYAAPLLVSDVLAYGVDLDKSPAFGKIVR